MNVTMISLYILQHPNHPLAIYQVRYHIYSVQCVDCNMVNPIVTCVRLSRACDYNRVALLE